MMFFKQVRCTREYEGALAMKVCWIPEQFAHVGKCLEFIRPDGVWENGWIVREVFTRMAEEYVREHECDYRTQAEASDKFTPNKGLGL